MKSRVPFCVAVFLAGLMFFGPVTARSAPPEQSARAETTVTRSNAIPQSVFTIPTSLKEGRDPFFPKATYWLGGGAVAATPATPAHADVELVLKGLSGTAGQRLAIINGRTVAQGEEMELPTSTGRIRVRCVEIKADSVVVEVAGQRRELRLRD